MDWSSVLRDVCRMAEPTERTVEAYFASLVDELADAGSSGKLMNIEDFEDELAAKLAGHSEILTRQVYSEWLGTFGVRVKAKAPRTPAPQRWMRGHGREVQNIIKSVIREARDGPNKTHDKRKIARRISRELRKAGSPISPAKAKQIAQTEVTTAVNVAGLQAYAKTGVERIRWVTKQDTRVRATHRRVHRTVRVLGKRFANGLLYPGDPSADISQLIGCRCVTIPAGPLRMPGE